MNEEVDYNILDLEFQDENLIKVIGVGGGGCNSVNYLYDQKVEGVSFLVCNTDKMSLAKSSVPAHLQLGPGWGAGGQPKKAEEYAETSRHEIEEALNDGTQMLFIAAGMGGGTGTGASPIIAEVARKMNILTVGIVTIPFAFEGEPKIIKAMNGVQNLAKQVDAILIVNNEKLKKIYPDLTLINAFKKADDVVANAARSIAEIITVPGYINTDFQDVYNTLKDGKVAIMSVGRSGGEHRITDAIRNALDSPLINGADVHGAKRILFQLYCSEEQAIVMEELDQVHAFVREVGEGVEVQWGISFDPTLGEEVRVTIVATGYDVNTIPSLKSEEDGNEVSIETAMKENYKDADTEESNDNEAEEAHDQDKEEKVSGFGHADEQFVDGDIDLREDTKQKANPDDFEIRFDDEEPAKETITDFVKRAWFR